MLEADEAAPAEPLVVRTAVLLIGLSLLIDADLVLDARAGTPPGHMAFDLLIAALALGGAAALGLRLVGTLRRARALKDRLRTTEGEAQRFREESRAHLQGLSAAIDGQCRRWALSPAEREVVLLLLKGLSHKEIGGLRGCSERTVRHQARAAYRKAGLAGRIELAAFFLEDLLVPAAKATEAQPGSGG